MSKNTDATMTHADAIERGEHLTPATIKAMSAAYVKADNGMHATRIAIVIMGEGIGARGLAAKVRKADGSPALGKSSWQNYVDAVAFATELGEADNKRAHAALGALFAHGNVAARAAFADATGDTFVARLNDAARIVRERRKSDKAVPATRKPADKADKAETRDAGPDVASFGADALKAVRALTAAIKGGAVLDSREARDLAAAAAELTSAAQAAARKSARVAELAAA